MKCASCLSETNPQDAQRFKGLDYCPRCYAEQLGLKPGPSAPAAHPRTVAPRLSPEDFRGMKQYKVLTQKDRFFSGKFSPEVIEQALNSLAGEGWSLRAVATASISSGFGGAREELMMIMEREQP